MLKKVFFLTTAFSILSLSQAHAQQIDAPSYQPYYQGSTGSTAAPSGSQPTYSSYNEYATTNQPAPTPRSNTSSGSPFAPISDRIVSDPLYLPMKGQVYGTSAYTFGQSNYDNYNSASVHRSSVTGDNNTLSQSFAYGISDEFSLHVSDSYEINDSNSTSSASGMTTTSNSNGLVDPTFGATWRVVDQAKNRPVDVDLTLNYAPDMFTSSSGASGHDGSVASGQQTVTAIAGIGREMKNFSILGEAQMIYDGERHYQSSASGDLYSQPDGFNYALSVNTQTRLTDRFSFNLGTGYNFVNDRGASNNTIGTSWSAEGASSWVINTALNYHFIPNKLVGSLTYTYDDYTNSGSFYANSASDSFVQNHDANVFGARLAYVFD